MTHSLLTIKLIKRKKVFLQLREKHHAIVAGHIGSNSFTRRRDRNKRLVCKDAVTLEVVRPCDEESTADGEYQENNKERDHTGAGYHNSRRAGLGMSTIGFVLIFSD